MTSTTPLPLYCKRDSNAVSSLGPCESAGSAARFPYGHTAPLLAKFGGNRSTFSSLSCRRHRARASLGASIATKIVLLVDPWCYPSEQTQATVAAYSCLQSAVVKV